MLTSNTMAHADWVAAVSPKIDLEFNYESFEQKDVLGNIATEQEGVVTSLDLESIIPIRSGLLISVLYEYEISGESHGAFDALYLNFQDVSVDGKVGKLTQLFVDPDSEFISSSVTEFAEVGGEGVFIGAGPSYGQNAAAGFAMRGYILEADNDFSELDFDSGVRKVGGIDFQYQFSDSNAGLVFGFLSNLSYPGQLSNSGTSPAVHGELSWGIGKIDAALEYVSMLGNVEVETDSDLTPSAARVEAFYHGENDFGAGMRAEFTQDLAGFPSDRISLLGLYEWTENSRIALEVSRSRELKSLDEEELALERIDAISLSFFLEY
ncbi:MAG: hypothetical protein ACR2QW_08420 [bacterium]